MKSNSALSKTILSLTLLATSLAPLGALAQGRGKVGIDASVNADVGGANAQLNAEASANFCAAVNALNLDLRNRFSALQEKIDDKRLDIRELIEKEQEKRDEKIDDIRDREDERLAKISANLQADAEVTAERQAILKFQAEVRAAVLAKRRAMDAANLTFRTGLKSALEARRTAVAAAITKFNAALRAAYAKAKTDCANGVAAATVRANLAAAIKDAKEKLQAELREIDTMGKRIQPLIEARRLAHAKAIADFKAALDAAKIKLKAALEAEAEVNP